MSCKAREAPIEPNAAHKKMSDGSFAVCSSIVFATGPSRCCGFDLLTIFPPFLMLVVQFFCQHSNKSLFNEKMQTQDKISTKCLHICGCVKCDTQNGEAPDDFKNYFY